MDDFVADVYAVIFIHGLYLVDSHYVRAVYTHESVWQEHFFEGTLEGSIAFARSGSGGFGYDPVFIADDYPGVSVAELPEDVKNAISHRGKALRLMARWLQERE